MKRIDVEIMIYFIHRQGMYIHPINRETIVSFMHGVDFGRQSDVYWTTLLRDFVSSKYGIHGGALGWPNQVEIYSKEEEMSWEVAFKKLMLELIEESELVPYTIKLKMLNKNLGNKNND